MSYRFSILLVLLLFGCDESGPIVPPSEALLPEIAVSLGFGDSPLEGELLLTPPDPGVAWRYEIDFGDDADFEIVGRLEEVTAIPYRFHGIGVHGISIRFFLGDRQESMEEFVVVNDPDAVSVLARADLFDGDASRLLLGGIATDGQSVFVAEAPGTRTIHRLDVGTLELLQSRSIPGSILGDMLGFAALPERNELFVAEDDTGLLDMLSLPDLEVLNQIQLGTRELQYVEASSTFVYVGGGGIVMIEPVTGEVLFRRDLPGSGHFDISPDEVAIVVAQERFAELESRNEVRLLDAGTLADIWAVQLAENERPRFVAFSPDGDVIYVVLFQGFTEASLVLSVLDRGTGQVLRRVALGEFRRPFASNPIATSSDGRFIAIPTFLGAFFIDTTLDLVRYRTVELDLNPASLVGCCNVAAGSEAGVFYFSGGGPTGASVHKVLVQP